MTEEEKKAKRKKQQADFAKRKRAKLKAEKTAAKAADAMEKKGGSRATNGAKAVRAALKSGKIDAVEVADRIIKRFDGVQKADANLANVSKRTAEAIKSARKSFETTIGETVGVEDRSAKAEKLDRVLDTYGDLQRAQSDGAEERKAAKKARKQAHDKFSRAIEEARQPELPGLSDND